MAREASVRKSDSPSPAALKKGMIEAAHVSGRILMKHFRRKITLREKPGAGLVTNADLESERSCVRMLRKTAPSFGFLTEEAPEREGTSEGRWIVDPLDGTTNYVHGFPMFCVSIAAEWRGEVMAGVIYHPVLDETYWAVQGGGAFVNRKPIRVSSTASLKDSLLTTGFTYRKDEWLRQEMESFERLSAVARAVRRPGSAALDMAYTARGVFDGFWERRLSPWDVAAGAVLIAEAGGKVTDFEGKPYRTHTSTILASNSRLHPKLLQAVAPESCPI
jgi:myo-inositol-1(or 4)-monophosphatase